MNEELFSPLFHRFYNESMVGKMLDDLFKGNCDPLSVAICGEVIKCSEQRKHSEGGENLLKEAVANVVRAHIAPFMEYRLALGAHYACAEYVIASIATEFVDYSVNVGRLQLKRAMSYHLNFKREELFNVTPNEKHGLIEHPMSTFNREFNVVDQLFRPKAIAKPDLFMARLRLDLINLLRAGNAVFEKHEWVSH